MWGSKKKFGVLLFVSDYEIWEHLKFNEDLSPLQRGQRSLLAEEGTGRTQGKMKAGIRNGSDRSTAHALGVDSCMAVDGS